jgi:protein FAM32A
MAPPDEYSTVGGGGRLKLKGSKVQDGSRVDKNKKKKSKSKDKPAESESATSPPTTTTTATGQTEERDDSGQGKSERALDRGSRSGSEAAAVLAGKTEAERRYEEARKRRVSTLSLSQEEKVLDDSLIYVSRSSMNVSSAKASSLTRNE